MTATGEATTDVACSFCLKASADVATLVSGPGVFICDECVALCSEIIDSKPVISPPMSHWRQELPDEELLALLPKVAAASVQADEQLAGWVRTARTRGITWTRIGAALSMTRQSAWERFSGEE
jgi:hypothetical protein